MILLLAGLALASTEASCVGPVGTGIDEWRPTLSGEPRVTDADGFRVHWTTEGEDDAGVDRDGDGTPDFVQATLDALLDARERFEEDGWRPLVPDSGAGGSDAIDVYVMALDINGYANPAQAAEGEEGASCFVRLDPATARLGEGLSASIALHELHHCVQFRYGSGMASWAMEASATFEQYRFAAEDPTVQLALDVLWIQRLGGAERALDETDGRFEYAGLIAFKHWEERAGPLEAGARLPALWERLGTEVSWQRAFAVAAREDLGASLSEVMLDHAVWNARACARDDGAHYGVEHAGCTATGASVPIEDLEGAAVTVALQAPFASRYVRVPDDGDPETVLTLSCDAPVSLALLQDDTEIAAAEATSITAEHPAGDVVVVFNGGLEATTAVCTVGTVERPVDPSQGCGCRSTPGLPMALLFFPLLVLRRRSWR